MPETLKFPIRGDKLSMQVEVEESLCHVVTPFQTIDILRTQAFGKVLLLDGHIQLTDLDEAAYHESLVQVPLHNVDEPALALVVGGGDGGVIRELCKHETIERVDMVEIDSGVIDACRKHMPGVSGGAFDDPRVNLVVGDAFEFVRTATGPYDLIVVDCTDVYEGEDGALSEQLFTDPFYRDLARVLSPKGFVATQADNLLFCPYSLVAIRKLFGSVFAKIGEYHAVIPSFGGFSGFCWGSHGADISLDWPGCMGIPLSFLDATTYAAMMHPLRYAKV